MLYRRHLLSFLSALLLSVWSAPVCFAQQGVIAIGVKAEVLAVEDSEDLLQGQVTPGSVLTGRFFFPMKPADQNRPEMGVYEFRSGAGIELSAGSLQLRSAADEPRILVEVHNNSRLEQNGPEQDIFLLRSYRNAELQPGVSVEHISWQIVDPAAAEFSGTSLPPGAFLLHRWKSSAGLLIDGKGPGDADYFIRARVVELFAPGNH